MSDWEPILHELREWGVFTLVVTGGEPLMSPHAFEFLQFASDLGFNITLLTDFDGLTSSIAMRLAAIKHLNTVQTSLDGGFAETHDFIRGQGSFDRTMRRLDIFKDSGLRLTLSTSVNKLNIREIDRIVTIYHSCKARYLYLNPVAPYGRAKEQMMEYLLDDQELKWLGYRYYWAVTEEEVHSGNAYWQDLTEAEVLDPQFHPFKTCLTDMSIGATVISINSRGAVYLDSKMKSENLLPLGNVKTKRISEMWRDERLTPLRTRFLGGRGAFISHKEVVQLNPN
jgi:MoaA/NifB/PqqE/SkfB family radical SAM enzyme